MAEPSDQPKKAEDVRPNQRQEGEDRTAVIKVGLALATEIKVVLALVIVVLFVLFIIQNSARVNVDFVFVSKQIRLVWVFLSCAIIGGIVAWLIGRPRRKAQRRLIEELERYRKQAG
ncbi:MAG TPA: LapA family protein [Actinomycetota bacterium]|jgi:uncharacterized integral membrane protein